MKERPAFLFTGALWSTKDFTTFDKVAHHFETTVFLHDAIFVRKHENTFKCAYPPGSDGITLAFKCRIYIDNVANTYLIEFQRKQGDAFEFMRIVNESIYSVNEGIYGGDDDTLERQYS